MSVFSTCIYVYHMHAYCLWRPEEGSRSPGALVKDDCELPCGCRKCSFSGRTTSALDHQAPPLASFIDHVYGHVSVAVLWVGEAQQVAGSIGLERLPLAQACTDWLPALGTRHQAGKNPHIHVTTHGGPSSGHHHPERRGLLCPGHDPSSGSPSWPQRGPSSPSLTINRQAFPWVADNGLFVGRPKDL